eukprot:7710246-Pyramimonas_sp.AAC.1
MGFQSSDSSGQRNQVCRSKNSLLLPSVTQSPIDSMSRSATEFAGSRGRARSCSRRFPPEN